MVVKYKAKITGSSRRVDEDAGLTLTEEATPLTVGDTSGALPDINVTSRSHRKGPIHKRSGGAVGDDFELISTFTRDDNSVAGETQLTGSVRDVSMPGERAVYTVESVMSLLNAERRAEPHFGTPRPEKVTTSVRTNLHTNPSRENDLSTLTALPGSEGAVSFTRPGDGGYVGDYYARVTWTTAPTAGGGTSNTVTVLPNTFYSQLGYYRVTRAAVLDENAVGNILTPTLTFYSAANAQLTTYTGVPVTAINGQWAEVRYPLAVSPANASYAIFSVVGSDTTLWAIDDTLDSDAEIVETQRIENYFDGSSTVPVSLRAPSANGITVARTYAWTGTAGNSTSTETTTTTDIGQDYTATEATAFRYYCGLVGITNTVVDPVFEQRAVAYLGWEGNVWTYLKNFAAAIGGEIALVNDSVTLREPRTREISIEQISDFSINVTSAESAQFIDIANHNTRWATDEAYYREDNALQVTSAGYVESIVTFDHDILELNQPEHVDRYDPGYLVGRGQYTVIDSQGVYVPTDYWTSRGGRVYVEPVYDTYNSVRIVVRGCSDSAKYIGPYQIGFQDGNNVSGSLVLTGSGVFTDKRMIRMRTGLTELDTSTISQGEIDNIFVTDSTTAMSRGLDAATRVAGPVVSLSGSLGLRDVTQGSGWLIGSRIKVNDNVFRVRTASYSRNTVSFTADADMTFRDMIDLYSYTFAYFNNIYSGLSFADFNALYAAETFEQFTEAFGAPSFEDFNSVFDGATFADHAVYPYVSEVQLDEPSPV